MAKTTGKYRFSFGPWNISQGADPFGPVVRKEVPFAKKVKAYRALGFDHIQLHDDDVVPPIGMPAKRPVAWRRSSGCSTAKG